METVVEGEQSVEQIQLRRHSNYGDIQLVPLLKHPTYRRQGYIRPASPNDQLLLLLVGRLPDPHKQVIGAVLERYRGRPAPAAELMAEFCPHGNPDSLCQTARQNFSKKCREVSSLKFYRPVYSEGHIQIWEVKPPARF